MGGRTDGNRHYEALAIIREFIDEHGFGPTIRELATLMGLKSESTAYYYMRKLEAEELISWDKSKSRTVQLVGTAAFMRTQKKSKKPAPKQKRTRNSKYVLLTGAKRKSYEQDCFDRAVKLGLARNKTGVDPLHDPHSLFPNGKFSCTKVG